MKTRFILTTVVTLGALFSLPPIAIADESSCQQMVKKCFSEEEGVRKSNCFYRVAENKECKDTETGKVAHKRWLLSGAPTDEGAQAFLGPIGIDLSCTTSCDNQWLAFIIAGESSQSVAEHVDRCLETCRAGSNLRIPTP